nr:hypothetical protein [Micromonospora sp. DSM 115978]
MTSFAGRLFAAALGLALLASAAPAQAAARTPASLPVQPLAELFWAPVSCATGELTAYVAGPTEVWVSGWIEPCPQQHRPPVLATFSVGYYLSTSTAVRGRDISYDTLSGRTPFGGRLDNGHFSQLTAVCLTFSAAGRVACLAVEPTAEWVTVVPIATDDPRVAFPIPHGPPPGEPGTNPTCGNCV